MSAKIGELKEFNIHEDWALWKERLDQYFLANDIPNQKKVALLITLLGSDGYALLRNLCTPTVPSDKSFEELTGIMESHLQPQPNIIAERFKFKGCRQKESESIKAFLTNLKRLPNDCDFDTNLDNHLRDQFVWGLRHGSIQKRLLGEKDLTYARAVELAHSLEAASRDAAEMGTMQKYQAEAINYVGKKPSQSSWNNGASNENIRCFCCGKGNHRAAVCKYRQYRCSVCKKEGYLAQVCKVNKVSNVSRSAQAYRVPRSNERHNYVREVDNNDCENFDNLFHLQGEKGMMSGQSDAGIFNIAPIKVELLIHGITIQCDVDTGSAVSAISEKDFKQQSGLRELELVETSRRFRSHPGQAIIPMWVLKVEAQYKKQLRN